MKFAYSLLKTLVDLKGLTPEEVKERLTFAGFEVEDFYPATRASKVVSGRVLSCVPHPDSTHLHILQVDLGPRLKTVQIVCGAPNVRENMNVIVALPGCELPGLGVTIQTGVIRGQKSAGMCCSLVELGVERGVLPEKELAGIHDLGADFPPGDLQVLETIGLTDTILDVNILPNRPDCLSYQGLARELSALLARKLLSVPQIDVTALPRTGLKVALKTPACRRLSILTAQLGSKIDEKYAAYLRRYLWLSGLHSVSPLIDLGNFCTLLTGQPHHLYDFAENKTATFVATDDYAGKFWGLDEREYLLAKGDVVIVDGDDKPLCLGGIMGGKATAVTEATREIALETACFYSAAIRHTGLRLGLTSLASTLFAKGVNPRLADEAATVAAYLLKKLFPEAALTGFSDAQAKVKENEAFTFSREKLNRRLGTAYTDAEINRVLQAYGLEWATKDKLVAPWWRLDLREQADVDEEVFRYYPATKVPKSYDGLPLTIGGLTDRQNLRLAIKESLRGLGYSEIMTFTLVDEKMSESLRVFNEDECYKVKNPLTRDHAYVRADLVSSMLKALQRNIAHKREDLAFFEISPVDTPQGLHEYLALGLAGRCLDQELKGARPYDFYDLKGAVFALLTLLGLAENRVSFKRTTNEAFHPGKAADLWLDQTLLGTFGVLSPLVSPREILLGEFDLNALLAVKTGRIKFAPYSQFPPVRRDLSFALKKAAEVDFAAIEKVARKAGKSLLRDTLLFDCYDDTKTGQRYLGLALFFGARDHTLTDEETQDELSAITKALVSSLPLTLRK